MPITIKELKERRRQQQQLVQEQQNIIDRQIDTSPSRAGIAARHIRKKVLNMPMHPSHKKSNLTRHYKICKLNNEREKQIETLIKKNKINGKALKSRPTLKNKDIVGIVKKTLKATQKIAATPYKRGARGRKRHRRTRKHRKHKKSKQRG